MQKFTDSHMRTSLNEQLDKPIRTLDEFVSFGKSVCKSVLQESYSDAAVEKNLIGLYNSCGCDLNETMKAFDTITMPRKEFGETMNCKLNQLFEELKSNPADTTISVRIAKLVSQYPTFLNESVLKNTAVLLERCDLRGAFDANNIQKFDKISRMSLSTYEPKSVDDIVDCMESFRTILKESVLKMNETSLTKAEYRLSKEIPLGYGGFDTDFIKMAPQQVNTAIKLDTELANAIETAKMMSEKEKQSRQTTMRWFKSFMNDDFERYNVTAETLIANGIDVDLFVKWSMDQFIGMIWQEKEFLLKNFYNNKFAYIKRAYNNYLLYTGIAEDIFEAAALDTDHPVFDFYRTDSYSKMYELYILVTQLSNSQELHKRKLSLVVMNIVKPMIDALRLDKQILRDRTQLQY